MIDGVDTGILAGHAYGIMDVFKLPDERVREKGKDRDYHRLLRIRNPWGHTEWKGKWTQNSETEELEDDENVEALEKYIESLEEDERFDLDDENDGTFLINFKEWRTIYNKFFVV